jgi:hypothetical protein
MRIIMRYSESDGCTYSCENIYPIEYESCEAALLDFEVSLKAAGSGEFKFANLDLWGYTFYSDSCWSKMEPELVLPEFLTIDEWFGEVQQ